MAATIIYHLANPPGLSAAPVVTLQALNGQQYDLAKSNGKMRLVSFFSPNCSISKRDIATLSAIHASQETNEMEVIAVSMSYDNPDDVKELATNEEISYAVTMDSDGNISRAFPGVRFTPTTFLIDSNGEIVWRHVGRLKPQVLKAEVEMAESRAHTHASARQLEK